MNVTPHFTAEEFACKDGTPYPPAWVASRLQPLCIVLEAIRAELDHRPVTIVSGYRTPAHNRAVGGSRHSRHMEGDAADIRVAGVSAQRVHAVALRLHQAGTIRLGGLGAYARFTHVDVRPGVRLARWSGSRVTA